MKTLTREWVSKAEGDFASCARERRARKQPNYDAACFHAEQCAEKYLKAVLQELGIDPPRTHNLIHLLELLLPSVPTLELLRQDLQQLSLFAVSFRYPGESADRDLAKQALELCVTVRAAIRTRLRLK